MALRANHDVAVREMRELGYPLIEINRPRTAAVEFDLTGFNLNWQLTLQGDGQGVTAKGHVCRYRNEADAHEAGRVWVATGVSPADQRKVA